MTAGRIDPAADGLGRGVEQGERIVLCLFGFFFRRSFVCGFLGRRGLVVGGRIGLRLAKEILDRFLRGCLLHRRGLLGCRLVRGPLVIGLIEQIFFGRLRCGLLGGGLGGRRLGLHHRLFFEGLLHWRLGGGCGRGAVELRLCSRLGEDFGSGLELGLGSGRSRRRSGVEGRLFHALLLGRLGKNLGGRLELWLRRWRRFRHGAGWWRERLLCGDRGDRLERLQWLRDGLGSDRLRRRDDRGCSRRRCGDVRLLNDPCRIDRRRRLEDHGMCRPVTGHAVVRSMADDSACRHPASGPASAPQKPAGRCRIDREENRENAHHEHAQPTTHETPLQEK